MDVRGVWAWFSKLSVPQWVMLVGDVLVGLAAIVALILVILKVLKPGVFTIVVPMLVGAVMATAGAWYQADKPPEPLRPPPVVKPTAKMDPQPRPLAMCSTVKGKMTQGSESGYALAVGVAVEGEGGTTWYEGHVQVSSDKRTFTVTLELGDTDDRGKTYVITPIWMKKAYMLDLIENSQRILDEKDVTYFALDELPETAIPGQQLEVTRRNSTPC